MDPRKKDSFLTILSDLYPNPRSELNFKNPYQLLVAVVLSAQCTDKKVNQVTPSLFKQYKNFKVLASAKVTELQQIIKPINYYRTKAKNLIACALKITNEFSGKIPSNHEELILLPGVGRKTANVVLGELGHAQTLPVDTHVMRVSKRLGLSGGRNPLETEKELQAIFKPELWRNLHHWLILHGRRVCKARNPNCSECALRKLCPSSDY